MSASAMVVECCSCGCVFDVDQPPVLLNCGHQPCQPCVDAHSTAFEKRCPTCSKKYRQQQAEGAVVTLQRDATVRLVRLAAADVATTHDAVAEELQHAEATLAGMRTCAAAAAERQDLAALCAHAACAERVRGVLHEALQRVLEEACRCQDQGGATGQHPSTLQGLPRDAPDECVPEELKLDIDCEGLDEEMKLQVAEDSKCSDTPSTEGQRAVSVDNVSNPETTVQDEADLSAQIKMEDVAEQSSGQDVVDQASVTQDVVVQGASEGTVAVKEQSCLLESLPSTLLQAVLAFVPTTELLSLRLLSRRWSALVLDEPLWRHRRLKIPAGQQAAAGILRLAPALRDLHLEMSYPPLRGVAALRALAEGACQVRYMRLAFLASTVTNKLITRALRFQRGTLRDLYIDVTGCSSNSNLVPVLEAIDDLEHLVCLQVRFGSACPDFTFRRLRVKNLSLLEFEPISERTRRSLLDLGRHTLRRITLPFCLPVRRELARCSKLATLTVEHCHGLREVVPELPGLKRLSVVFGPSVAPWLQWAHDEKLPVKTEILVKLYNAGEFQHFADSADSLGNAQAVAIYAMSPAAVVPPALLTRCLQSLTLLETLMLEVATDYEEVLRCWSPSTAPRLQELTVRVEDPAARSTLERGFKTWRPSLKVKYV